VVDPVTEHIVVRTSRYDFEVYNTDGVQLLKRTVCCGAQWLAALTCFDNVIVCGIHDDDLSLAFLVSLHGTTGERLATTPPVKGSISMMTCIRNRVAFRLNAIGKKYLQVYRMKDLECVLSETIHKPKTVFGMGVDESRTMFFWYDGRKNVRVMDQDRFWLVPKTRSELESRCNARFMVIMSSYGFDVTVLDFCPPTCLPMTSDPRVKRRKPN
jgi:hypothetical protein